MFRAYKFFIDFTTAEKKEAKQRYLNAISVSVQGSAIVVLRREVNHIFINAYNKKLMQIIIYVHGTLALNTFQSHVFKLILLRF